LIDALANAPLQGKATDALDHLSRFQSRAGHHVAAFNPVCPKTIAIFKALLSGEFALDGFYRLFRYPPRRKSLTSRLRAPRRRPASVDFFDTTFSIPSPSPVVSSIIQSN